MAERFRFGKTARKHTAAAAGRFPRNIGHPGRRCTAPMTTTRRCSISRTRSTRSRRLPHLPSPAPSEQQCTASGPKRSGGVLRYCKNLSLWRMTVFGKKKVSLCCRRWYNALVKRLPGSTNRLRPAGFSTECRNRQIPRKEGKEKLCGQMNRSGS